MIKEIQHETQKLRAELNPTQTFQLDKMINYLADVLGDQNFQDLIDQRDIERLEKCKNLIKSIYRLLREKEIDSAGLKEYFATKEFWDWEVGERKIELVDEKFSDSCIPIDAPYFSADGEKYALRIKDSVSNHKGLVVNGVPWDFFRSDSDVKFNISNDGSTVAACFKDEKGYFYVVNNKAWTDHFPNAGRARTPRINKDGSIVAVDAAKRRNEVFVVNDEIWPGEFVRISFTRFSPDNKRVAANVYFDKTPNLTVIVDKKKWDNVFRACTEPFISPDSQKVAVGAYRDGEGCTIFVDDQQEWKWKKEYKKIADLAWSPDSKKLAARVYKSSGYTIWQDQKEWSSDFGDCEYLQFSPDSQKLAATVTLKVGDNDYYLAIDGKVDTNNVVIGSYSWSPDSQKIAHQTMIEVQRRIKVGADIWQTIINGNTTLAWSPDSQKLAVIDSYTFLEDPRYKIIINDQELPDIYKDLKNLTFSPDSRLIMFIAQKEDGQWYRIVKDISNIK